MTNSKIKASQVRAMLYKLRLTWGDKYHVFTDQKLYQLDSKIKTIDPAWPVPVPKERTNNQTPKILVNPAFVGKVRAAPAEADLFLTVTFKAETAEDETERMRAELLQKEKELLALKRKEIDQQIATFKRHMDQVIFLNTVQCHFLSSENTEINIHHQNLYCTSRYIGINLLGEELGTMMRNDLALSRISSELSPVYVAVGRCCADLFYYRISSQRTRNHPPPPQTPVLKAKSPRRCAIANTEKFL